MNTSFVFVLKSESCGYKQNRQLSFLVERDTKIANFKVKAHKKGIPVYKICITIILMKKNRFNVEHFRYHIIINNDTS